MRTLNNLIKLATLSSIVVVCLPVNAYAASFTALGTSSTYSDVKIILLPAALLIYYLLTWILVGRDPAPGHIVTQYNPPANMSPAKARYLLTKTSDYKAVAAVLAHLAAQKIVSIKVEKDGYRITRLVDELPASFPLEEAAAFRAILEVETFSSPADMYGLAEHQNPRLKGFLLRPNNNDNKASLIGSVVAGSVIKQVDGLYFDSNLRYSLPATALSILVALAEASTFQKADGIIFQTMWFLLCSLMISLIVVMNVIPAIRDTLRGRLNGRHITIAMLPLLIFGGVLGFVALQIAKGSNTTFAGSLIVLVLLNVTFTSLLSKMTTLGRQCMDQLFGFRQFLATVELDRLERLNDPHITPALLNNYLAYAIAFDLKEAWGDHLSNALFAKATTSA
jgi:hypothetical protein